MPMGSGYWGAPWGWFGWIMPLICLLFVVMMAFLCFRMMRGCMVGHGRRASGEIEDLRTQIRELREEISSAIKEHFYEWLKRNSAVRT
jgi:uncharacterized membrane-anchored protein YhcB (DUF1043 family)